MDVTVCVATFGDSHWTDLAHDRALPSATRQGCPVVYRHGDTLAGARNAAIAAANTEWVVVLDADDELSDDYCRTLAEGTADIRSPRLVEVYPDGTELAVPLAHRDIEQLNPLPISSMARRDDIIAAGGFAPWPAWEDWALWLRMVRRGATYEHMDAAVLYAHVRDGSRNRDIPDPAALHRAIRRSA